MSSHASVRPAFTPAYRVVLALGGPVMAWGRLHVTGLDALPADGPTLLVADHDSYWDPIAIGVAARELRQVRALAKATLWKTRVTAAFMTGMGHIPVTRGVNNDEALATAVAELRAGACIGMFPEGTRSLGRVLRARSGVGRLAEAVPEATVVCVRSIGTVDVVRVPHRPAIRVEFFRPRGGGLRPDESPTAFAQRLLDELRESAPREIPGRRRTATRLRRRLEAGT
ncbi:lysophospholipid acyltransferase family protein [uncultured Jatrophihabitans sp.]|uniref:lysophospholipid acyltransferase family protein n=1 Tax=uncultured Jatrophihabitans sp. TaxID=1610747 RepID=UPI0035CBB737